MAKSTKKVAKKANQASPIKISTSLFQRNSRNSTGSRASMSSLPSSATKKAAAKLAAAARESKSKTEKGKGTTGAGAGKKGTGAAASRKKNPPPPPSKKTTTKTQQNDTKSDAKSKRTLSNASSASSTTSAKVKVEVVKAKTPSKPAPGKRGTVKKDEVKVVKAKAVERTSSTASSTISSRRTSTNASRSPPPPKTRSNNKDSKEKSSTVSSSSSSTKKKETPSTRSPSRSPSPRLRNQSTSNNNHHHHNVHTRTRSQSGSSSFPSSPISSTSSSGNTSSSGSSSAPSSPPAQRKKKMTKKKVTTTTKVIPKKVASKVTKKVISKKEEKKKDSEKKSTKKVELPPRKKTRSSSGDSSKSLRTIGGARRIIRSPSSPSSSSVKLTSTKNSSSKKQDRVMAKKITKKAIKATKPKPKPKLKSRPKSKKRMASLNAKAILEASFKEEEKKVKATPSPKISKHSAPSESAHQQSSTASSSSQSDKSNEIIPKEISDIKNLLRDVKIEIRSGPPVNYKEKSPEKIERKRKSSGPSGPAENSSSSNKDVESSRRSSPPRRSIDSKKSSSSEKGAQAGGSKSGGASSSSAQHSGRKSSPVPKKKTKVATAETSTSTPAWNWDPNLSVYPQKQQQQPRQSVSYGTSTYEPTQYNLTGRQESLASRTDYGSKSQGCQARTDSPAIVAGRTVYQPAGPLIEPHKTPSSNTAIPSAASVGGGYIHIPESVRLPPDLKVTYQTHPPSSLPPPVQSKQSSRSSSSSGTSKSGSSKGGGGILHQPYKTSSASTSSSSTSTNTVSTGTQRSSNTQRQSLLSAATTSTLIEGNNAGAFGALQQPLPGSGGSSIGTHTAMTAAAVTAMGGSGAAHMYYPGYAGPHHSSPFAPSKFPIVPPDSFRAHSPYPPSFLYAPPQAGGSTPQNFYMTPFYTPPMTPTSAAVLGSAAANAGQPRQPVLAPPPHHPHASPALAAASAIYQSNHHQLQSSSSADQSANYYITPPTAPLQPPSHHSIPSQSSPGHAGLFPPNQSSPPACPCPTDSYPQRNSTITTSNSNSIISSSKPPLQQRLPQQTSVTPGTHSDHHTEVLSKNPLPARRRAPKDLPPPPPPETPKTDAKAPKQQESVMKTFSEQYSLPDDITITPILVPHGTTATPTAAKIPAAAVPKTAEVAKKPVQKPKDIVHVINPRSGATTTIAKHMSSSSAVAAAAAAATVPSPVKNVSPVKPNNAVTVGKIHPDLDVIVIAPGRCPVPPASSTPVQAKGAESRVGPFVNIVQPEKRSDTDATQVVVPTKRKGIHECVDGLQKKRLKEVEAAAAAATAAAAQINGDRRRKSASPTAARAMPREQVFEMRNSTIVNEREAVVAASALVVPSNRSQIRLSPHKNGLKRGLGLRVPPGHTLAAKYQHNSKESNSNKPVATRSSTANAKIKTRSSAKDGPVYTSRVVSPEGGSSSNKDRHRLLRRRVPTRRDQSQRNLGYPLTISTNGRMKSRSPYMASPSSASSSSSGGQVILRIPKVGLNYSDESGSSSHRHHRYYDNPRSLLVPATALRGSGGSSEHHGRQYVDYAPALPHGRPFVVGESSGRYKAQIAGSMAFSAMKKRAIVKPLSPNVMNGALHSMMTLARRQPRWSNGWRFEGEPFEAKVYLTNDDTPVIRRCYPAMKHDGGDVIHPRDCVLLKSGPRKTDLPFVAKVAALWENPVDGEMMFSLLWYYRPEHTELGRQPEDMPDEIFASKHRDCNSVATIEDRCFVLTLNEYCRYKKRLKQLEEGITAVAPIVPLMNSSLANINSAADIAQAVWNNLQQGDQRRVPPPGKVSADVVFFCRKVYDFRQKRMLKNPT